MRRKQEKAYFGEMREQCAAALTKAVDYLENIDEFKRPFPDVKPGFLLAQMPKEAPQEASTFDEIFKDFDKQIMPGVSPILLDMLLTIHQ